MKGKEVKDKRGVFFFPPRGGEGGKEGKGEILRCVCSLLVFFFVGGDGFGGDVGFIWLIRCMSALSNFIQSEDADVCKIAVDALQQLSSHRDNRDVIRNDFGIADSVRLLVVNKSLDVALRRDAVKVLRNVLDAEDEDEVEEIKEIERYARKLPFLTLFASLYVRPIFPLDL